MPGAVKEHVVYIHGVSNDEKGGPHDREYDSLHSALRSRRADFPAMCCKVEWGWRAPGDLSPQGHELLTDAQGELGKKVLGTVHSQSDFTFNPLRLAVSQFRPLLMLGFSDMFYYVSSDGKNSIRRSVASQILSYLRPDFDAPEAPRISLTLVGHSAGSVIAFDLLFYLFYRKGGSSEADAHVFIKPSESEKPTEAQQTLNDLRRLRNMVQDGNLRIRRLFTFGSPISMLAFRSNAVLKILAGGGRIDSGFHGLTSDLHGEPLTGPRWVNIWDKDDPIAWPVEDLMSGAGSVVVDRYVDVSDNPLKVHNDYWSSSRVHETLAEAW